MTYTLHLGDCLEYMKSMPDKSVDAVITDPPYGVDLNYFTYDDTFDGWKILMDNFIPEACRISRGTVIVPTSKFEGEVYLHKFNPIWRVCWYKGASCTRSPVGFKDWETAFIFNEKPIKQIHDYFTSHANMVRKEITEHPCPKPLGWGLWFVDKLSQKGDTIFDPFMGSGTTGVAAIQLGRNFIGCEIDPDYFEIAEKRIKEAELQPQLFKQETPKPIQEDLWNSQK